MLIHEIAKRTGISAHTIRFYEKSGLIKGKRNEDVKSNNYFHYNEETVERLHIIRSAKSAGFTINEIAQFIDACFVNVYSKKEKLAFLDKKLSSLEKKIQELKDMKKMIRQFKQDVLNDEC